MSAVRAMKVPELREQLSLRGLDSSGLKAALVERLEAALATPAADAPANGAAGVVEAAADALEAGADPADVMPALAEAVAAQEAAEEAGIDEPVVAVETAVVMDAGPEGAPEPVLEVLETVAAMAPAHAVVVAAAVEEEAEEEEAPPPEMPPPVEEPAELAFAPGADVPGVEDTPAVVPAFEAAPEAAPGEEEAAPPADLVDAALAPAPQPAVDMQAAVAAAQAMAAKFSQEHEGGHVTSQFPVSSGAAHAEDAMGGVKRKFDDDGDEAGVPYKRSGFHGPGEMPEPRVSGFSDAPGGFTDAAAGFSAAPAGFSDTPSQPSAMAGFQPAAIIDPAGGGMPGQLADSVQIPQQMVGKLIGKMGETIKQLQYSTGTKVQIDHLTPGDKKTVSISGSTRESVEAAKQQIEAIVTNDGPAAGEMSRNVECPQGIVGRVIGRGGETIRALQQASQAHIVVEQNFPEGVPRKVVITGRPDAVERAVKMVTELIQGEPGNAQGIITKFGAGITRTLDCPKQMVGRVIGKGGETIKALQRNFGANIQIDQSLDPMKITVSGQPPAVDAAMAAVSEIVAGGNPYIGGPGGPDASAAYGGPRGPPGGYGAPQFQQYPPAGGYGGYGGYPMQATPQPAYGGYGGYAPYAQPYAQPASAAGYGGYGGGADPYAAAYGGGAGAGASAAGGGATWQELHDNEGRPYYYNTQTGVSQWDKPADMA